MNRLSTTRVPNSPSSSPITAKMKSVCASGSVPHFCRLPPSPTPQNEPLARANSPCAACQPSSPKVAIGSVNVASRFTRSGSIVASSASSVPRRAPRNSSTRIGAPTTQSMPPMIAKNTRAVPRSPWSTTMPATRSVTGSIGISRCFQSSSSFSLRAYRSATHRTMPSLATSDGWTVIGPPRFSQLRLPLTFTPSAGTYVRPIRSRDTSRAGYASQRISRTGIEETTQATGTPISTHMACLLNTK
jgi:hypothetical protein